MARTTSDASVPALYTIRPASGGDNSTAMSAHDSASHRGRMLATASKTASASSTASVTNIAASSAGFDKTLASAAATRKFNG